MIKKITFLTSLLLLACSSQTTLYTKMPVKGYSAEKITDTLWMIRYYGNQKTSHESVQTYWLYQTAKLALAQNYDGFGLASQSPLPYHLSENIYGYPAMQAKVHFLKTPLSTHPGYVFDARKLNRFLKPYVKGPKCNGNICPHVHSYLFPGF